MEPILEGLERNEFDAAIGAITLVQRFRSSNHIERLRYAASQIAGTGPK
jgi:hypothetical protein